MKIVIRKQNGHPVGKENRGVEGFRSRITGRGLPSTNRINQRNVKGDAFRNLPGMSAGIWFEKNK